ncbi:hypothetical protein SUDANB15_03453 [Streptomyces sp. enrichment culture]
MSRFQVEITTDKLVANLSNMVGTHGGRPPE